MTPQTQLRIPTNIKREFKQLCSDNHTNMTTEIVRFILDYITKETGRKTVITEKVNGLVQHPVTKTWMTYDEYKKGVNI